MTIKTSVRVSNRQLLQRKTGREGRQAEQEIKQGKPGLGLRGV